jgi:hypothetical protein
MFTDLQNREWKTDFTFAEVFQLDEENQLDILDFDAFAKVLAKPSRLLAVLYVLCGVQEAGISKVDFFAGFNGDVLAAASDSLWESYTNFIPADRRAAMAAVKEAAQAMEAAMVADAMGKIQDARRGSLPVSSESIQEPIPFVS